MNIVPTEYKLDTKPVNMINASEYEMVEVRSDDNEITNAQNVRIQLKDLSTFTNLYNAYLEIRFKIVKDADGTNFTANDRIALTNSVASLFSRCVLRLQNNIVEVLDEQHISAIVKGLLLYSDDYTRSTGTNELWFRDTGDGDATAVSQRVFNHPEITGNQQLENTLAIVENPLHNKGFAKREALCRASKDVTAYLPLSTLFGFCSIDRVITGNLVALELTRSQATDHLHAGINTANQQTANGKVNLTKVSMWCPRIMPSPQIDLELKSAIGGGLVSDYKYAVFNSYVSSTLPAATTSSVYKVLTQSEKILQAFVFIRNAGLTQVSPKWRTDIDIKLRQLEVRLNGKTYPARRYEKLETEEGRSRAYLELIKFMNKSTNYDSGIQLSLEEWKNTSIYAFDLRATPENWSKSPSTLEVVGSFDTTTNPYTWNVCVVSERHTQINYSGSQPVVNVM